MSSREAVPLERWPEELNAILGAAAGPIRRAIVLNQTDSTQDAARRLDARIGDVIIAGRQTRGRGRLGRDWADTHEDGLAMTVVLPRDRPERLAIAMAGAVADGIDAAMKGTDGWQARRVHVGIKWPNDIIASGRKIAGILTEQVDERALVGVGVNVRQAQWPANLTRHAISMLQLGFDADRFTVACQILDAIGLASRMSDEALMASFASRDALAGTEAAFRVGQRVVRGRVRRVDPMRGLAVVTADQGEVWLPAATTSVLRE